MPDVALRTLTVCAAILGFAALPSFAISEWDCDPMPLGLFPAEYDVHIQPAFDQYCTSCHQPGGEGYVATGLDLRPGVSYDNLINVPSAQDDEWLLVEPGNQLSLLLIKIACNNPPVGERMPKGGPHPPGGLPWIVSSWIQLGAPPPESMQAINFGMTGSWYDPETSGQGFLFDVVVDQEPPLMVLYWFTYGDQAGGPEAQRWFTAEGHFEEGDHSVELDVMMHTGGVFVQRPPETETTTVGVAELTFQACDLATLAYDIDLDGDESLRQQGELALTRLSPDVMCEVLSDDED